MEQYITNDVTNWIERVSFTKLPQSFNNLRSPWKVSSRVNNSETINKLLAHSFVVQSSTIPSSPNPSLRHFILSNCCIQICNLIKYYLSHLNVESAAHCGALKSPMDSNIGVMHVFLVIENEIVDNTYVHMKVK